MPTSCRRLKDVWVSNGLLAFLHLPKEEVRTWNKLSFSKQFAKSHYPFFIRCWEKRLKGDKAVEKKISSAVSQTEIFLLLFPSRRQESQYEMTGLYSETQDDSSADLPQDTESESLPSTITVTTNYEPQSVTVSTTLTNPAVTTTSITSTVAPDTVIKCHSRQPSSTADREKTHHGDDLVDEELLRDCGILSCRPVRIQKAARIKVRNKSPRFVNKA